jgi:predicted GIY-YIG superfamily endonuclease
MSGVHTEIICKHQWVVYCLATVEEPINTYIGATIDRDRRLQQHNYGCKAGGAKATSRRPAEWYRVCFVQGFQTKNEALKFEWRWKYFSRKINGPPLTRRQKGLDACLEWAKEVLGLVLEVVYE